MILWVSMAAETEFHFHGVGEISERHVFDLSVAAHATHAFCNMYAVIEVDVIGERGDFLPCDRH